MSLNTVLFYCKKITCLVNLQQQFREVGNAIAFSEGSNLLLFFLNYVYVCILFEFSLSLSLFRVTSEWVHIRLLRVFAFRASLFAHGGKTNLGHKRKVKFNDYTIPIRFRTSPLLFGPRMLPDSYGFVSPQSSLDFPFHLEKSWEKENSLQIVMK